MKQVWAPWRIKYILGKKQKKCFLCVRKTKDYARKQLILKESKHALVMLNKYPYTAGHLMVVTRKHVPCLETLTQDELTDFFMLVRFSSSALMKAINPDGMNMGANIGKAAGAGAEDHFHFHIVARWNGDNNFLPVLGKTMVMSEYLEKTYDRLLPFFKKVDI